jgi:predicted nucleic acid-binding protein
LKLEIEAGCWMRHKSFVLGSKEDAAKSRKLKEVVTNTLNDSNHYTGAL